MRRLGGYFLYTGLYKKALGTLRFQCFLCRPLSIFHKPHGAFPAAAYLSVVHRFRIDVMSCQTFPCDLLPLRPRLAVIAERVYGNPAAGQEFSPYLDIEGIHKLYQVIHDNVHTVFMKIPMVPETEQIQLQRLAFHHTLAGHI